MLLVYQFNPIIEDELRGVTHEKDSRRPIDAA